MDVLSCVLNLFYSEKKIDVVHQNLSQVIAKDDRLLLDIRK